MLTAHHQLLRENLCVAPWPAICSLLLINFCMYQKNVNCVLSSAKIKKLKKEKKETKKIDHTTEKKTM
jgi:hypothetical protein